MSYRKPGLTLIEVLASIALLTLLLSMVAIASARYTEQLRLAQDKLLAQELAEELLASWLIDQNGQIDAARGDIAGKPGWTWRLSGRADRGLEPFNLHVGRLDIVRSVPRHSPHEAGGSQTLVSIEFASSSVTTANAAARGTR